MFWISAYACLRRIEYIITQRLKCGPSLIHVFNHIYAQKLTNMKPNLTIQLFYSYRHILTPCKPLSRWKGKNKNYLYDIIKLQIFFSATTCCSYKTQCFHKIFAKFRFVFASLIFAKKCEISQKSLRNATENFRIFSRIVSFAGNPRIYFCASVILSTFHWSMKRWIAM